MANQASTPHGEQKRTATMLSWNALGERTSTGFILGGLLLVASFLAPVGLARFTDWSWVAGLELVGLAVLAVAAALVGLAHRVRVAAPKSALAGAACGVVAGVAAFGLLGMGGYVGVAGGLLGLELPTPKAVFTAVSITMAAGYGFGMLLLGTALVRTEPASRYPGSLLILGGSGMLIAVVAELLRRGVGLGTPDWLFLPALALVTLVTVTVGFTLDDRT